MKVTKKYAWVVSGVLIVLGISLFWNQNAALIRVNVVRLPSGPWFFWEHASHPRLKEFQAQEQLDLVVAAPGTDLEKVLRLAHWAETQFPAGDPFQKYPPYDALDILRMIRQKHTGGFCAQYSVLFAQACLAYGYPSRIVGTVNKTFDDGHVIAEVYLPEMKKWIAVDPEIGQAFQASDKTLLTVLDLHNHAISQTQGRVVAIPSGKTVQDKYFSFFYHFKYGLRNNFMSVPVHVRMVPQPKGPLMVFEPYQLRWVDRHTKTVREQQPSIPSSRIDDFYFQPQTQDIPQKKCYRLESCLQALSDMKAPETQSFRMPLSVMKRIVREVLLVNKDFHPLE